MVKDHIGYSYRLTARVLLYEPSHRQDNTYHGLCYTSRGALAGTRNSSMGPPHEGSIRRSYEWMSYAVLTQNSTYIVLLVLCIHLIYIYGAERCSSVVRAFAYVTVGRLIDCSWWTH